MKRKHKIKFVFVLSLILIIAFTALDMTYLRIRQLKIRELVIQDNSIPESFNDTKIIVFSDLYGDINQLEKVTQLVEKKKPDFIIFLGNMMHEEDAESLALIEQNFKSMEAPLGKYAVLGANDYVNLEAVKNTLISSDFRLKASGLSAVHRYNNDSINFVFFDKQEANSNPSEIVKTLKEKDFSIGFTHNPIVIDQLKESNLNYLLAGKTNLGKVNLPGIGSLLIKDNYIQKEEKIGNVSLNITSGLSSEKPNIRLFTKPDVIVITLKSS